MEGYLTIKEVAEKYIEGCQTKIQMPTKRLIGKSIMAGMMIAMGAGISSGTYSRLRIFIFFQKSSV